jgi:hypothetical protein
MCSVPWCSRGWSRWRPPELPWGQPRPVPRALRRLRPGRERLRDHRRRPQPRGLHGPGDLRQERELPPHQFTDVAPIIDEAAGTITFVTTFKGLPEKIKTPHGGVLLRDAGVITFVETFDLNTGAFISSETIVKGPHPEADSDFQLFCEVVSAALA